jgi:integrase
MAVYRLGKKWFFDFRMDGRRNRKGGHKTQKEALEGEAKARLFLETISSDFIKLCESRLKELESRRTAKHLQENNKLLKELIILWGAQKTISQEDIEEYLNGISKISMYLANRNLKLIKALFNHGIRKKMFTLNPVTGIPLYPVKKSMHYIPPFEDIRKVLVSADEEQRKYLLALIYTAARVRELNALKWEDVYPDYLILRTKKSKNSDIVDRKIPLNEPMRVLIDSIEKVSEYVFTNKRTKTRYDYRKKMMHKLCKDAKVRLFTFHALRHFTASFLDDAGTPLTAIRDLLGHQRSTTTDLYLQSLRGGTKQAVDRLNFIGENIGYPSVEPSKINTQETPNTEETNCK